MIHEVLGQLSADRVGQLNADAEADMEAKCPDRDGAWIYGVVRVALAVAAELGVTVDAIAEETGLSTHALAAKLKPSGARSHLSIVDLAELLEAMPASCRGLVIEEVADQFGFRVARVSTPRHGSPASHLLRVGEGFGELCRAYREAHALDSDDGAVVSTEEAGAIVALARSIRAEVDAMLAAVGEPRR